MRETVRGVAERGGESVRIFNSGTLVLLDRATGSFWIQLLAQAICAPASGDRLSIVSATIATWGEWPSRHPKGEVLLSPPHSGTVAEHSERGNLRREFRRR